MRTLKMQLKMRRQRVRPPHPRTKPASLLAFPPLEAAQRWRDMDARTEELWEKLRETAGAFSENVETPGELTAALDAVATEPSPALALAGEVVGNLFRARNCPESAADAYRLALETHNALETTDPDAVGRLLAALGEIYDQLGLEQESLDCYEQAIPLLERIHGELHAALPTLLNNAAVLSRHLADFARSEELFHRALTLLERRLGTEHRDLAPVLNNYGLLCDQRGEIGRAEGCHIRALAIREREFGPKHPDVAQSLANLAATQVKSGRTADACNLFARAYVILRNQALTNPLDLGTVTDNYITLLHATGQDQRAGEIEHRSGRTAQQTAGAQ